MERRRANTIIHVTVNTIKNSRSTNNTILNRVAIGTLTCSYRVEIVMVYSIHGIRCRRIARHRNGVSANHRCTWTIISINTHGRRTKQGCTRNVVVHDIQISHIITINTITRCGYTRRFTTEVRDGISISRYISSNYHIQVK